MAVFEELGASVNANLTPDLYVEREKIQDSLPIVCNHGYGLILVWNIKKNGLWLSMTLGREMFPEDQERYPVNKKEVIYKDQEKYPHHSLLEILDAWPELADKRSDWSIIKNICGTIRYVGEENSEKHPYEMQVAFFDPAYALKIPQTFGEYALKSGLSKLFSHTLVVTGDDGITSAYREVIWWGPAVSEDGVYFCVNMTPK